MRTWTVLMLLGLGLHADASEVSARLITDGNRMYAARKLAGAILERAGVTLRWAGADSRGEGIRIEIAENMPEDLLPGALAVAYPYSGCSKSITLFADRIRQISGARPDTETAMLAYVIAHEIGHVLQGMDHHSVEGVMKEFWSLEDRAAIFTRRLEFAEEDVLLIRQGIAAGACQAGFTARSATGSAARPERP